MKKIILFVIAIVTITNIAFASKPIYLWKDIKGMEKEKTRLYVYEAPDSLRNGISVIICPGGSYHHLGLQHEGYDVAKWLTSQGITAFVLRYRVGMRGYHHPAMIEDLQRAIQFVRENAHSYGINLNKLGVMGFFCRWTPSYYGRGISPNKLFEKSRHQYRHKFTSRLYCTYISRCIYARQFSSYTLTKKLAGEKLHQGNDG